MTTELMIELRGRKYTLTEISAFEDRSVGIGWHVEEVTIKDEAGAEIDYDSVTDAEWAAIDKVVLNAQADWDWPDPIDEESSSES